MNHRTFLLITLVSISAWARDVPRALPDDPGQLISALLDADPSVRKQASDRLVAMGLKARPAVLQASRDSDPRLSSRAAEVLMKLPWALPDDPPAARQLLAGYGQLDEESRARIIVAQLTKYPNTGTTVARLLREDPSATVRWAIFGSLPYVPDESLPALLRNFPADDNNAPAIAAVARAWLLQDLDKAVELLRRAVDVESRAPSDDLEQFAFAYDLLAGHALMRSDPDEAADIRRDQVARLEALDIKDSAVVGKLFQLHADFGPLQGFEQDLRDNEAFLGSPEPLWTLARLYRNSGLALLFDALCQAAIASGSASVDRQMLAGQYLAQMGWNEQALQAFRAILGSAAAVPQDIRPRAEYRARYAISRVLGDMDNDAASAAMLKEALDDLQRIPNLRAQAEPELAVLIEWRKLRAARAAGDEPGVVRQLDLLAVKDSPDADVMIDVVNELKKRGRNDEAQRAFVRAYGSHKQLLATDPTDAESMNNLAWLCARCGEKLDEAVYYSSRATQLEPHTSAYLDTAAEAQYLTGAVDNAVRLETLALMFKPGDPFMTSQLKRFQSGVK